MFIKLFLLGINVLLLYSCNFSKKLLPATAQNNFQFIEIEDSFYKSHKTVVGINSGWSIYKDIIFPGTDIKGKIGHKTNFFERKNVLKCSITGGDAYNNIFFTNTMAKLWKNEKWLLTHSNKFSYSMDFYVDEYIDCKNTNLTELEGLEFIFQKSTPPYTFLWGIQWSKNNIWSIWDDTKMNNKVNGWINLPDISPCIYHHKWNSIRITGYHIDNKLYYDALYLNDDRFTINKWINKSKLPDEFSENYIQTGFQINGNKAIKGNHHYGTDPVNVYLDKINLIIN